MDNTNENEELPFFYAREETASISDASDSCLTSNNCTEGGFPFNVWIGSPESVKERRRKFFDWMGVCADRSPPEISVSAGNLEANIDRVKENGSGAVLRTSGFVQEFSSSLSSFSFLSSSSSDMCQKLCLREKANVNDCKGMSSESDNTSSTMAPCFQHCKLNENKKQSNFVGLVGSLKMGWLGRLRSMGCVVDKQSESNGLRSQDCSNSHFAHRVSRVKVKQYRKQLKELSALYKGQDIKAHEGSILTMKFSHDGKFLASAGEDGIVRVWKVLEDKRSRQQNVLETDPCSLYFDINDFSELKMKPVLMDEAKTGKPCSTRRNSDSACVVFPQKVFRISEKPLHEFHGHKGEILDVSWSEKNYLLSASVDKTVRLWRVGRDNCFKVFTHSNYVTSVQFNPVDKNYFISGSIDGKIRVWEISGSKVVDWADVRDIVTAVCYRPDGKGGIIGSLTGNCRFFNISDSHLELDAQICLRSKKKSLNRRITGFQFFPQDLSKVMVSSADSQVRILHGFSLVGKYKVPCDAATHTSASFSSNGKHVISACEDSNVCVWNCIDEKELSLSQVKKIKSCERFSADASVAIPWCGFPDDNSHQTLPFSSPSCFPLSEECVLGSSFKVSATWPEENLPSSHLSSSTMDRSQYKFLKACYQNALSSHAWGMVIVTAGWDGRIRSFHNYGLPAVPA